MNSQPDYAKNTYEQHQMKQAQQLFPNYSYNKKNGYSPIKQTYQSSQNLSVSNFIQLRSMTTSSDHVGEGNSQLLSLIQEGSKLQNNQNLQPSIIQQQSDCDQINSASPPSKFIQPSNSIVIKEVVSKESNRSNVQSISQDSPIYSIPTLGSPILSSRVDISGGQISSYYPRPQNEKMLSNDLQKFGSPSTPNLFDIHSVSKSTLSPATILSNQQNCIQMSQNTISNHTAIQPQTQSTSFTKYPTKISSFSGNPQETTTLRQTEQQSFSSTQFKAYCFQHRIIIKAPGYDSLQENDVNNIKTAQCLNPNQELKTSVNMGSSNKQNTHFKSIGGIPTNYIKIPTEVMSGISSSKINSQNTTSPDIKKNGNQLSSLSPNPVLKQGNSLTQSYYKVASQIRRNNIKDPKTPQSISSDKREGFGSLTGSTFAGHANSNNQNLSSQFNSVQPAANNLTLSINSGKINQNSSQVQLKQQIPSRSPSGTTFTRQKSNSSLEGRQAINPSERKKRVSCADKFNEKYTKKMIIDLCNYMSTSQDGSAANNGIQNSSISTDKSISTSRRENFHVGGGWKSENNPNMNMLDMLSQQRVLQRSISSSKRLDQQVQGIKDTSSDSKANSKEMRNLNIQNGGQGFKSNEKPWENNSFNSRFSSNSGMRSANHSTAHLPSTSVNLAKNWTINGTSDISVTSNPAEITSSILIKKSGVNDLDNNVSKGSIIGKGTFILKGFNDSQEIHSSRNLQMGRNGSNQTKTSDQRNVFTKTITNADLSSTSSLNTNQIGKYKFSSNHLSKPSTSSNSFAKSQQPSPVASQQQKQATPLLSSRTLAKGDTNQYGSATGVKNSVTQPSSPIPNNSSYSNSKNSTKSEIKKSILSDNGNRNSQQKEQSSSNTYSQSFDKDDDDFQEEEEEQQEIDFDIEAREDEIEGEVQIPNEDNQFGPGLFPNSAIPFQFQTNVRNSVYNFDSELEHHPEVQVNLDELKKERQKLIRKIISTFKVKNKALSTSQEYYEILHVVGKGAFAKVCLAIQLLTGKLVAIKLIDKQILKSDSAKKRVLQEVLILKKLNGHKHVLKLLEVFENRKLIFIVTEYFRGMDLMKMMKERNGMPFSEDQVRHMLAQILSGLRYIHANMVLHRDIKLDNLLVDSSLNLKIIDFGISRVIQKDQRMTEQCGTPAFLAPEIIANKGYDGFASDFWSLGVLIYILLYGRVPFKGNNLQELHKNILNGILPKEEMRDTIISIEASDLIQKILKVRPKERIGLDQIIQSPWMKSFSIPDGIESLDQHSSTQFSSSTSSKSPMDTILAATSSMNTSMAVKNEPFDEKVICHIESFGYSREYILRCLAKGSLSHVNAIYKLLKKA